MYFKPIEEIRYTDLPDPILRYDQITNRFVLMQDLITPEIIVPAGEYTDGASVPDIFTNIVKSFDRHLIACIVHDYMYRLAVVLPGYEERPKRGADDLFGINLIRCDKLFGLGDTLIPAMVDAVRAFGRGAYGSQCNYPLECNA